MMYWTSRSRVLQRESTPRSAVDVEARVNPASQHPGPLGRQQLGIRLTMGTPIVFRQERAGLDGVPFTILKFRTMRCGRRPVAVGLRPTAESRYSPNV